MNNVAPYPIEEEEDSGKQKFFFESTGQKSIIKTIEYSYIQNFGLGGLYNLGFGDYDPATGAVSDDINSNNGDLWSVASTVLSTIPLFFEDHPYDTISVQGSDSIAGFEAECRQTCTQIHRRCKAGCKNLDRRINTYRYFLDKNHDELAQTYAFGGYIAALRRIVPYQAKVKYDAVLVSRKVLPNFVPS